MKITREEFDSDGSYLPRNNFFNAAITAGMTGGTHKTVWEALEELIEDGMQRAQNEYENQPEGVDLDFYRWWKDSILLLWENLSIERYNWQDPKTIGVFGHEVCHFPLPPLHGWPAIDAKLAYENAPGGPIVHIVPAGGLIEDRHGAWEAGSKFSGVPTNFPESN